MIIINIKNTLIIIYLHEKLKRLNISEKEIIVTHIKQIFLFPNIISKLLAALELVRV